MQHKNIVLGGNDIVDHEALDTRVCFYLADSAKPIKEDGQINSWKIFSKNNNPLKLIIYRAEGNTFSVVGCSEVTKPKVGANEFPLDNPIQVRKGDLVGWYYPGGASIAFTAGPEGGTYYSPAYSAQTALTTHCNRIYAIEVCGVKALDVSISYIFNDGLVKRSEADEYVEITNQGCESADISGWKVNADDRNQDFVFPDGTILAVGQAIRVYTNQIHPESGGFSFGSGRAIWNNKGDEGKLYDAQGAVKSIHLYDGENSQVTERTLQSIKNGCGVPDLKLNFDQAKLEQVQKEYGGDLNVLDAFERALNSLIMDPADWNGEGAGYNAANQVRDNWDSVPANADAAAIQQIIREHVNGQSLKLNSPMQEESGADVAERWIFQLCQGMGDMHFVIVDRSGKKPAYQEVS